MYNRLTRLPTNCGRCSLSIFTHLKISITCSLLTRSRWIANVKYVPVLCAPLLWKRKQDINKNNHGYCVTYSNRPDRIAKLAEHWASLPGFPPLATHIIQFAQWQHKHNCTNNFVAQKARRHSSISSVWHIPAVNYYRAISWTLLSLFHAGQQIHHVIMVFRDTMLWPVSELHVSDHLFSDCSFLHVCGKNYQITRHL